MRSSAIKKIELMKKISKLPTQKIKELDKYIQKLLSEANIKKSEPDNLKGIWENKGFEKIADLENEIISSFNSLKRQKI